MAMPEPTPVRARRIDRDRAAISTPHVVAHRLRLAILVREARRLAHRRVVVEAASARARRRREVAPGPRDGRGLAHRAARLNVAFHRLLDQIHAGGLHDEALAIFRAYRVELGRRLARHDPATPPDGPHRTR